jgi:hypothetical protein
MTVKAKNKLGVRTTVRTINEHSQVKTNEFEKWQDLKRDLDNSQPSCNRLYILEDIGSNWIEVLGPHFSIDPSFFARHLRVTRWENSYTASNAPPLPSSNDDQYSFSLRYPELVIFQKKDYLTLSRGVEMEKIEKIGRIGKIFCNTNLYREITFAPFKHGDCKNPYWVGIVRRKLSFWSRIDEKTKKWDGE